MTNVSRTERDITVKIEATGGQYIEFKATSSDFNDEGDWAIEGGEYDSEYVRHRGKLTEIIKGDEQPFVVTGTPHALKFRDTAAELWCDIIEWKSGGSSYVDSNWVPINGATVASAAARFPTWKVTITLEGTDHGGTDTSYVCSEARVTYGGARFTSGRPATGAIRIEAVPSDVTRA